MLYVDLDIKQMPEFPEHAGPHLYFEAAPRQVLVLLLLFSRLNVVGIPEDVEGVANV